MSTKIVKKTAGSIGGRQTVLTSYLTLDHRVDKKPPESHHLSPPLRTLLRLGYRY